MLPINTWNALNVYGPAFIYAVDNVFMSAAFLGFCETEADISFFFNYQKMPTASAGPFVGARNAHSGDSLVVDLPMNHVDDRVLLWTQHYTDIGEMSMYRANNNGLVVHFPQSPTRFNGYYLPSVRLLGMGLRSSFVPARRAFRFEADMVRVKYDDETSFVRKNMPSANKTQEVLGITKSALESFGFSGAKGGQWILALGVPPAFLGVLPRRIPSPTGAPLIFSFSIPSVGSPPGKKEVALTGSGDTNNGKPSDGNSDGGGFA
jgi:hypothetical protein